jgi:hypothetical protein
VLCVEHASSSLDSGLYICIYFGAKSEIYIRKESFNSTVGIALDSILKCVQEYYYYYYNVSELELIP